MKESSPNNFWIEVIHDYLEQENFVKKAKILKIVPVPTETICLDSTDKFLIIDSAENPVAFVLCSNKFDPEMVFRGCLKSKEAYNALGHPNCDHIVLPLGQSEYKGLTFAVFPYLVPLSKNRFLLRVQKLILLKYMHELLYYVANQCSNPAVEELDKFSLSLRFIINQNSLSQNIRQSAEMALDRLDSKSWKPVLVLMHGDLWLKNIMLKNVGWFTPFSLKSFVMIDWGGSALRGYPIYDLVRITSSLSGCSSALFKECLRHAKTLNCDLQDVRSYLLAALGHFGINKENMPYERWHELTESSYNMLEKTLLKHS